MTPSIKSHVLVAAVFGLITVGSGLALAQETVPPPPPPAAAPPPVGGSLGFFGERGQFVISADDLQLLFIRSSESGTGSAPGSSTTFLIQPALDYFISPNFSVGGFLGLQTGSADNGMGASVDATFIGVGARAGYNFVLTNTVSLWPRAGIGYNHGSFSGGGVESSASQIPLFVYAPVLWHPVSHFFIGFGPSLRTDLTSSAEFMGMSMDQPKTTQIGVQSTIGGYFGGL